MSRYVLLFFSLLLCEAHAASLRVAVSSPPLAWLVQQLGGDKVEVSVLLRPGDEPELFEPRPQQMQALAASRLYFALGLPFERQFLPRLDSAHLQVVALASLQPQQDPHIWMSVVWMQLLARRAALALQAADPADAGYFGERRRRLQDRLQRLDADLRQQFAGLPPTQRVFLVEHPALGYFAHDYGLTQLAVEAEGREPGPAQLAQLLAQARAAHIRRIFVERQFAGRQAATLATQLGAQVLVFDPLGADWEQVMRSLGRDLAASMRAMGTP